MNRRNKTKASSNATAKAAQPSKQPAQTQKPPTPAPAKPATPVPARAARRPSPPPPPQPTPSAILRQAWQSFETWLSAQRAEKDKKVSLKMKELMSGRTRGRYGKAPATGDEDIGAFEDQLNDELASQARAEWLKRVAATGLDEADWTDITEAEMAKVEAAFVPQQRSNPPPEVRMPIPPPPPEPKPAVVLKTMTAGRGRYAARVEEEDSPTIPGGWESPGPGVPAKGVIGKTRPETPAQQARANILSNNGWTGQKEKLPTPESLWEMHMNKPSTPAPASGNSKSESLWDRHHNGSPDSDTPPSTNLPTPENTWDSFMSRNTPQPPAPPSESMWDMRAQKMMFQPEQQAENPWDLHASKMARQASGTPAQVKVSGLAIPPSRTPAPSRPSMPISDSLWESVMAAKSAPPLEPSASFAPTTPTMAPSSSLHGYVSPVFIEMEDDNFPRLDDPLPQDTVEEAIRNFHLAAAEADIELRRQMLAGKLDDEQMEQLVLGHLSSVEQSARNIVEQWNKAREVEIERLQAEAEQARIVEEQKRRLAEAKKNGKKKWGLPTMVATPEPVLEPAQPKKKGRRGTIQQEAAEEARAATPMGKPMKQAIVQEDTTPTEGFWKAPTKPNGLGSSMWTKPSTPSAPTPVPTGRPISTRPTVLNPFASNSNVPKQTTPELSPWEAAMAKKKDTKPSPTPAPAPVPEPSWGDSSDADGSAEGGSFWENAIGGATGGAASAWSYLIGGQQSAPPPPKAPTPKSAVPPPVPDAFWPPSEDTFARNAYRGPTPAAPQYGGSTSTDGRFATWQPPRRAEPEERGDPAKKMADLALENLLDITSTGDNSHADDIFNAMSMYSKAHASATRKQGRR